MISLNELVIFIYTTIIVSLIWGRFYFFKIGSSTPSGLAKLYDPVVLLQWLASYYYFYSTDPKPLPISIATLSLFATSLLLFWWSVYTVKKIDFAMSDSIQKLVISGPYALVRHPFYISYALAWIGTTVLFNSLVLWITLIYLIAFYYWAATEEEKIILRSRYSNEYEAYCLKVGMFLPRISKWKI